MRVLLIEDEFDVATQIKLGLKSHFIIDHVDNGSDGVYYAQMNNYDVALIDIGLPDMSGTEVCKLIKNSCTGIGLIMLTAKLDLGYKVSSLDLGADDYVTKPFVFAELISRINAVNRRTKNFESTHIIKAPDIEINSSLRLVLIRGIETKFTKKEYGILEYLVLNKGRIVRREELLNKLWENDIEVSSNSVDVHMRNLRKKLLYLNLDPIETHYGFGYKYKVN